MKELVANFFKGFAMGAANAIPGVSGGTIALIVGIFERLINAIKSFDITAIRLLLKGKLKDFAQHVDLVFLISIFAGVGAALISLARLFEYLFEFYPTYIWSFFFGLVLASVYFVGKTVNRWDLAAIISFVAGTAVAILLTLLTPASENDGFVYLLICGVVAICSMILPGLSGSFVLMLMGNYQLVVITAVNDMRFDILLPILIGAGAGLLAFSHFLSWLLKKYKNQTIALLTGFIMGSLGILYPWKNAITQTFGDKVKTIGYDYFMPEMNSAFFIAVVVMILGIALIWVTESWSAKKATNEQAG